MSRMTPRAGIALTLAISSMLVATSGASAQTAFDASTYVGKGDAYNCDAFASQAQSQQVLRADPSDPNKLDQGGKVGVACEAFVYADTSRDEVPATPPAAAPAAGNDSSTSTTVTSPTSTSTQTDATTTGNVTVTGGAGDGSTTVNIYPQPGGAAAPGTAVAPAAPGIAAAPATAAAPLPGTPGSTQTAFCAYKLGFAMLHDLIPAIVGSCRNDERHNGENGDGLQDTAAGGSGGLLVWRKADNWTAFTDGHRTWVNGPVGVQMRLNTQRFGWEANPENLPPAAA